MRKSSWDDGPDDAGEESIYTTNFSSCRRPVIIEVCSELLLFGVRKIPKLHAVGIVAVSRFHIGLFEEKLGGHRIA